MLLAGFARLAMRALGGEEDCLPMSNILSALDGHDDATDLCIAGTKMDESCNGSSISHGTFSVLHSVQSCSRECQFVQLFLRMFTAVDNCLQTLAASSHELNTSNFECIVFSLSVVL